MSKASPLAAVLGRQKNQGDVQADAFARTTREDDAVRSAIVAILHDQDIVTDETALTRIVKLHRTIHDKWAAATESTIEVGRALNKLSTILSRDGFQLFIEKAVPFKDKMAIKLMSVAADVDAQRFHRAVGEGFTTALLPPITTAYELHTLDDENLAEAARRGLIAPDTPRTKVIAFKKELRATPQSAPFDLIRERARLEEERLVLFGQIEVLGRRIGEIDQLIDAKMNLHRSRDLAREHLRDRPVEAAE